ncbi:carboxy terminal-processing peptidase [Olleya sp. HaHaR_3_96]|uniref:carboxy terminal-processing peptidase n=1 Tax=Olleya sp. HaHaR_3_96 TaxID=2745560 RepID=UPI001C4FC4F6|nr:carboxy terminal-processing peptidase [Olleya sp. HaHaR_3_96]QXP61118.1 carboxy terminal-processing peptidase [Olleya sp. HaHaR_3_96]
MKRKYNIILLVLLLAFGSCSFTAKVDDNPDKDKLLIQIITLALEQLHFEPKELDDEFSKEIYSDYLEVVDPLKRYFLQSDIDGFKVFENKIDDQLKASDISFFNTVYNRLIQRQKEAKAYYKVILAKPFNYNDEEEYNTDYENLQFSITKKDLKERWRQQLKFNTLSGYDMLIDQQNGESKTVGADTEADAEEVIEPVVVKSLVELEIEARTETLKTLDNYFTDYIEDMDREDWFAMYVNTIVEEFDPHTSYMAPTDKDRFDQQMSGKLEGIGARLQKKMDYIKIVELISGGPAWRDGKIEVGDVIVKVRQDKEKEAISVVGMRIDDAIKLIKGPKGTKVILTMKKVDGSLQDIAITRDIVELEETYAKSSIVKKDGKNYGVINLPKFYVDFEDYNSRNASSDIKLEIERLKEQGIEGLVLDLRNNGGGSLRTVVDMAGLFIKEGPIVQVRSTGEPKEVLSDEDKSISWDGPLVIMVNELSASASEILAAAMQDYKRAIIIGSKQTYGKGTVQNVLDLNRMVRNSSHGDLGALKLTRQKFYRINGGSTQLEGVKSDVVVPDRYSFIDIGERDQENPLPWDKIGSVDYQVWNSYFDYDTTIANSKKRMENNEQLKLIESSAKWAKTKMDDNSYSLNYAKYKAELKLNEEEAKQFEAIADYKTNLTFESLPYEQKLFEQDTTLRDKRNRWHKNLSKDVYVEEAINVLNDLKMSYEINKVATIRD